MRDVTEGGMGLAQYRAKRGQEVEAVAAALGRLALLTTRRANTPSTDTTGAIVVLAEELVSRMTGAEALRVIRLWPEGAQGRWWPSAAELIALNRPDWDPGLVIESEPMVERRSINTRLQRRLLDASLRRWFWSGDLVGLTVADLETLEAFVVLRHGLDEYGRGALVYDRHPDRPLCAINERALLELVDEGLELVDEGEWS